MARKSKTQVSELASLVAVATATTEAAPKVSTKKAEKLGAVYFISKDFKPRTDNIGDGSKGKFAQQHNWNALVTLASSTEDGTFTYEQAINAVLEAGKANGYEATCNARGFVQGRVRGEHIVAA